MFDRRCYLAVSLIGVLALVCSFSVMAGEAGKPRVVTYEASPTASFSSYKLKTLKRLELDKLLGYTLTSTKQFTFLERDTSVLQSGLAKEIELANSQGGDESHFELLVGKEVDLIVTIKVLAFTSSKKFHSLEIPGSYRPKETVSAEVELKVINTKGVVHYQGREKDSISRQFASVNASSLPASSAASFSQVKQLFHKLVKQVVADMAFKLAPMRVLRVQKAKQGLVATINRGKKAGLNIGQVLDVSPPPIIEIDPSTNEEIEVESLPVGELEIIMLRNEQAHALIPEGLEVQKGYRVTVQ